MTKLRCAVVGATGLAGNQFIAALENHPWFEVTHVSASPRNVGKRFREALQGANGMSAWFVPEPLPPRVANLVVQSGESLLEADIDLVFSAVESDVAKPLEPMLARRFPVFSAASAYRYDDDVPLLIPPINADHVALLATQRSNRGTKGFIAPIPNCTTSGLAITLAPLHEAFGVESVMMTSLQAVSGAGRNPGVLALDVLDNVIPHIPKEEGKVEVETKKILGTATQPHGLRISCTCTRVAVLEGHTEAVFVGLKKPASLTEVGAAMRNWPGHAWANGLPSAPAKWIELHDDPFRPQPRLDREAHGGMATSVGRLREDGVLANGVKYVLVSHNTKMGAAKGALLVAELCKSRGLL